jgi:LysM repeat protein
MHKRRLSVLIAVVVLLSALAPVASAAPQPTSSIVHVVRPGETLSGIAVYYGVNLWTLARYNNIVNPNFIYVGQRLVIPSSGTTGRIHIVQRGETLLSIAARYGLNALTIAHANGIYNLNYIWVGQRLVIPASAAPQPAPAPQPTGEWYGQYYNNLTLTDPPCATRYDAGVNFNWGYGAPMAGVDADYFSVRWTRRFNFSGGTYRFYAQVDDGVRVWVDGVLIIDQWRDGSLRTFSAERYLAPGYHDLRVEYYDKIQVARIYFWWERVTTTVTPTPEPTETPAPAGVWHGVYYNNSELREPPAGEMDSPWIGFEWKDGSPMYGIWADNFSVRWTQTTYFDADTYRFCFMIDDGGRIWVDDELVVDEWHLTNGLVFCGEKELAAGNHTVMVEYYEWTGEALIYVWWEEAD